MQRKLIFFYLLLGFFAAAYNAQASDLTRLVAENRAAVVNISVTLKTESSGILHNIPGQGGNGENPLQDFFRRYFEQKSPPSSPPHKYRREGGGSGFIISADGYVLTNEHVVREADEITVRLHDRREFEAEVVGHDKRSDLALLKIEADGLQAVKFGDSDKLKVGQWVLAIGSPFGFDHSATQGIVSALQRSLPDETYVPFIQTDVAVNPGNSGGPLFNMDGEVVGINSQIYSRSGGYMGLSFAIPINVALHVVEQLKTTGTVSRGWLGVLIQNLSSDLAKSFGLENPTGAIVSQVMENSPAAKAGIETGDVILRYNGSTINTHNELPNLVGMTPLGTTVPLDILREGKEITLQVTIAELPDDPRSGSRTAGGKNNRLQITVAEMPDKDGEKEKGVQITKVHPDGPGEAAELRSGDVILKVNHQDIESVKQFHQIVKELPEGKPISILVKRNSGAFFTTIEIPKGK